MLYVYPAINNMLTSKKGRKNDVYGKNRQIIIHISNILGCLYINNNYHVQANKLQPFNKNNLVRFVNSSSKQGFNHF